MPGPQVDVFRVQGRHDGTTPIHLENTMPTIQPLSIPMPRPPRFPMAVPPDIDTQDSRFLKLLVDLRPYGGMLPMEDVRSIGFVWHAGLSLGESLIRRDLFALTWRHRMWLPMFQFRMPGWQLSTHASEIAGLLHPVLQGFELAEWFVMPSPWLGERCPVELIDTELAQVRHAAQADRFLLAG
jgi:hypothetical protein